MGCYPHCRGLCDWHPRVFCDVPVRFIEVYPPGEHALAAEVPPLMEPSWREAEVAIHSDFYATHEDQP